jgi:hypothetical protein
MGVCVSKVQSGPQGLEYTRGNEVLLSALGDQIETLAKTHPKEAEVGCEQRGFILQSLSESERV